MVESKTDYVKDAGALGRKTLTKQDHVPQVARYLLATERPQPVLCLLNYTGAVHLVEDRW